LKLIDLDCGQKATIKELNGGKEFNKKVSDLGVRVGKKVEMLTCQPFGGPIIIRIENMRIALGQGMASMIIVE